MTETVAPSVSLADKIEWLIHHSWPDELPPAGTNIEIAKAISSRTGEDMSSTTVWKLRTGRQDNPQFKTLTALATFFGVPIGYFGFAEESSSIDEDLTFKVLLRKLRSGEIKPEVLRALVDLSPKSRWLMDELILAAAVADRRAED
ncbi:XRE family transcriptional regulator [Actinocorallia populi]|uniref:XRE family transcriptional regulator n=1 Tax=Actinocorallia populi TaxID=2079200 RepID=UPI0013007BEB|nr:XRE family transcriptional regulator [Actinocorallia populi]